MSKYSHTAIKFIGNVFIVKRLRSMVERVGKLLEPAGDPFNHKWAITGGGYPKTSDYLVQCIRGQCNSFFRAPENLFQIIAYDYDSTPCKGHLAVLENILRAVLS